jgi:hypothetical protein
MDLPFVGLILQRYGARPLGLLALLGGWPTVGAYAQTVGDYRSGAGGAAGFTNRSSWSRSTGSAWGNNTAKRFLNAAQPRSLTNDVPLGVTCAAASPVNPLPATIPAFGSRLVEKQVLLNWCTPWEKDCVGFEGQAPNFKLVYRILYYYNGHDSAALPFDYGYRNSSAFTRGPWVHHYRRRQIGPAGAFYLLAVVAAAGRTGGAGPLVAWSVKAADGLGLRLKPQGQNPVTIRVDGAPGRLRLISRYSPTDRPDVVWRPVDQLHRGLYFVQVETELSRGQVRFQKV